MGGGGRGRNGSSLFFPKRLQFFWHLPKDKILSPANFCPCCHIDTKSQEAAKPSSAVIPQHPMAQDHLEDGGVGSQATSSALHLSHAALTEHYGVYGGRLQLCLFPTLLLGGHQACADPQHSPMPPLLSPSQTFASTWLDLPEGEYVQRLELVLGLENQPLSVPAPCCKLTLNLWQLWR